jgi:hypothetical protein
VQAARTGRSDHRRRPACDQRLGAGCEGTGLFVADRNEGQLIRGPTDRVDHRVRRVADHAVHVSYPGSEHEVDEVLSYVL